MKIGKQLYRLLLCLPLGCVCACGSSASGLPGSTASAGPSPTAEPTPEASPKPAAAESASGQIKTPALLKSVKKYQIDYSTQEWTESSVTMFEYENDRPVKQVFHEVNNEQDMVTKFAYTMNGDLPVERRQLDESGNVTETVTYDASGRIISIIAENREQTNREEKYFQYGTDEPYFTLVLHENRYASMDGSNAEHMEEVDSVILTVNQGLLQKTVNNGLYANWDQEDQKEWQRFNGTYTAEYDPDGIISKTSGVFRAGPSGDQDKFELTVEEGKVKEAVKYRSDGKGGWMKDEKFEFEYTDLPVSKERYASMINCFLTSGGGTYYIFHWY